MAMLDLDQRLRVHASEGGRKAGSGRLLGSTAKALALCGEEVAAADDEEEEEEDAALEEEVLAATVLVTATSSEVDEGDLVRRGWVSDDVEVTFMDPFIWKQQRMMGREYMRSKPLKGRRHRQQRGTAEGGGTTGRDEDGEDREGRDGKYCSRSD